MDETNDLDILTRTLFGEARGEPVEGQIAVAFVVKNRATWNGAGSWWGHSIAEVCQHPWQFSCWNASDPNSAKLRELATNDPEYQHLSAVAETVVGGVAQDPTNGATHYKVTGTRASWDKATADIEPVIIGHHSFYRLGPSA